MSTHRPGPYDQRQPSLAEILRATSLWTPGAWEVWDELTTRNGKRVHSVCVEGSPVLYTLKPQDANLAAAAPDLYRTVLSLLSLFETGDNGHYYFVSGTGLKVHVPRHQRPRFFEAFTVLAKARGRRWW